MQIKDLTDKGKIPEIILTLGERKKPRVAGTNVVQSVVVTDETGEAYLQLWGDDIKKFENVSKVKVSNGYSTIYKDQKQISAGKFGKIEDAATTKPSIQIKLPGVAPKKEIDFMKQEDVIVHIEFCKQMGKEWLDCFKVEENGRPQAYIDWAKSEQGGSLQLDDGQLIVLYIEIRKAIEAKELM